MADLTLYNVSNEFEYLCDLVDRDVLTPEEQADLTRMLVEKIQNSGDEIIRFLKTNTAHIEGIKAEIAELTARKKQAENRELVIKEKLTENMKKLDLKKIQTPIGTLTVPNVVDLSVDVVDIDKVPKEYLKEKTEISVDKTAVKDHFKETGEIIAGTNIIETPRKVQVK